MISVSSFLAAAEQIAAENPSYRIGGTGTDGTCDCIGLIVGAIRRAGGKWTGSKGSNYAARNEMISLLPIGSAADLAVGEAVYKAHEPGDPGYDAETIQNRYASSPDKRDYYHIGIVASVHPLRIRHMTTPTVKMDTSLGKWRFHGWLKKISREGSEDATSTQTSIGQSQADGGVTNTTGGNEPMKTVFIYGGNADAPVNMRTSGSLQSPILCKIPQNTPVELLNDGDRWCRISYDGKIGYVQSDFVHDEAIAEPESPTDPDSVTVPRVGLESVYDEIGDWLGYRG